MKEQEMERKKFPIFWFTLHMPLIARAGPGLPAVGRTPSALPVEGKGKVLEP